MKMLIAGSTVEVYVAIMNTGDSQSWKMLVFLLILIQLILSVKSSVMVFGRAELKLMSEFFFIMCDVVMAVHPSVTLSMHAFP